MKKIFLFLGARTPILAITVASIFISIFCYSANHYHINRIIQLNTQILNYNIPKKELMFQYNGNHKIYKGSDILFSYSQQATLIEGTIIQVKNHTYKAHFEHLNNENINSIKKCKIKIIDGKESIIDMINRKVKR